MGVSPHMVTGVSSHTGFSVTDTSLVLSPMSTRDQDLASSALGHGCVSGQRTQREG